MRKIVLVILDGLGFAQSRRLLGNIEGWVARGDARVWRMQAVLPTTSGPCYASIHTGLLPQDHGILTNQHLFKIDQADIFSAARAADLGTGAVAHSYFSSYFQRHPYDAGTRYGSRRPLGGNSARALLFDGGRKQRQPGGAI